MLYFDNAATTKTDRRVADLMNQILKGDYANASSRHMIGRKSRERIEGARQALREHFVMPQATVVFTSSATEANNLALFSIRNNYLKGNKPLNVVTTKIEHPSVYEAIRQIFAASVAQIRYIQTDIRGNIDMEHYRSVIDENTVLVSLNHVNNELGTKNDIVVLSKAAKEINDKIVFHSDIVQGAGKFVYNIDEMDVDMITLSAHKFHGPKGVGALMAKSHVRLSPFYYGGEQEEGLRPGTENVAAIEGLRMALALSMEEVGQEEKIWAINKHLRSEMKNKISDIYFHTPDQTCNASPYILNAAIAGCKAEVLSRMMDEKGIAVSTSSACSSKKKISRVLTETGIKREDAQNSIRISLSKYTTKEQCDELVCVLVQSVERLRKITKYSR
ncbi:MAG: cysteine desulfurase [Eubacteriaceae bacterium]|nr:cysteine desulfurase [Eubacteriaceae bacterium]